jgi:hypothetical protein
MQTNADLSHDVPLLVVEDPFTWEDACIELLASKPWDFGKGSPDKAWSKIVEPDVGKLFTNAAKIALEKGVFLRSELIDFFIGALLRLHSKSFKELGNEVYLTQKGRVNKALTSGMTALVFFGLFTREGRGAYKLTPLGEQYYNRLCKEWPGLSSCDRLYFSAHGAFASQKTYRDNSDRPHTIHEP